MCKLHILWENSASWGRVAPDVQQAASPLADGLCPRADTKLKSGGLGATIQTNTQTRLSVHTHPKAHFYGVTKSVYKPLFNAIDLMTLIDMENNKVLKPFTEMSKGLFKLPFLLVL